MENLFLSLWNRSMAAGWMILAVMLLRLALKKAPKSIRPWLWALVAVRLVCSGFGESALSLIPSAETIPQTVFARDAFQVTSGVAVFNHVVNEQLVDFYGATKLPAGHTRSFASVCSVVWLAGMVLLALWALLSWLRLRRRVAEATPEGDGVWVCGRIDSPFLLGLFRPRIYLPPGLEDASREYVLAHERAHIRRLDHLIKPLGLLLLTVYWFHPLMWAAYLLLCRDIELACDERVVAEMGEASKKPYSAALLQCSVHRSIIAACPLAFGEVGVKERVKNVLNYKKPAFWAVTACVGALIVLGLCFLTDPVTEQPREDNASFVSLGDSQPADPAVFAAGALLYQDWSLSYQPVDGGFYNPVLYGGDTLAITYGGETFTYHLDKTAGMAWDNLYDYFPFLAEEEAHFGIFLTDHNDLTITARFYCAEEGEQGPSVWTVQKEDGGGQRHWLYTGGRLYELISLADTFPFMANGVLWTYTPGQSTILPVRFDLEGGADVYAGADGLLSLDPRGDNWVEHLSLEQGQTVYWKPPLDDTGKPLENTGLHYYYDYTLREGDTGRFDEGLTLRPAMDSAGLYGGITYGVSNNWLGAASSQIHFTALGVDSESGDLVVSSFRDAPYMIRGEEEAAQTVQGKSGPVAVHDAQAEQ